MIAKCVNVPPRPVPGLYAPTCPSFAMPLFTKSCTVFQISLCSGVARVSCTLEQEIFLRPRQQKVQTLKRKLGAKVQKAKQNILL